MSEIDNIERIRLHKYPDVLQEFHLTDIYSPLDRNGIVYLNEHKKELMESRSDRPILLVITGPSGSGKDTVVDELMKIDERFTRLLTATTRPRREGEGETYHWKTHDEFSLHIENGELLEHKEYAGNYYGLLKSTVEECLNSESCFISRVDTRGALEYDKRCMDAEEPFDGLNVLLVMVLPENMDEVERRLMERDGIEYLNKDFTDRMHATYSTDIGNAAGMHAILINKTNKADAAARGLYELVSQLDGRM